MILNYSNSLSNLQKKTPYAEFPLALEINGALDFAAKYHYKGINRRLLGDHEPT